MKKFIFTLIIAVSHLSYGNIPSDSELNISAKLYDGRTIYFNKDVEELSLWDSSLDYVRLFNDEVVFVEDIESVSFLGDSPDLIMMIDSMNSGGIGGGG